MNDGKVMNHIAGEIRVMRKWASIGVDNVERACTQLKGELGKDNPISVTSLDESIGTLQSLASTLEGLNDMYRLVNRLKEELG